MPKLPPEDDTTLVRVPVGELSLEGNLQRPPQAMGIVLFAHGSGSSRHSARNRFVARILNEHHLGTLLLDLLSPQEEATDIATGHLRFEISLLAGRLVKAVAWLQGYPATAHLPIGVFGSSTGGAAALVAAAQRPDAVRAVVSRGGRPDLAGSSLSLVKAPTLLIVGGHDFPVVELNQQAFAKLRAEKQIEIVPDATHLFEETGALDQVAQLAGNWFERHLSHAHGS